MISLRRICQLALLATVFPLLAGCGGQIRAGAELEAELTRSSEALAEVWADGADVMLEMGFPIDDDMYCDRYSIGGGRPLSIEVLSRDFDPIALVIDSDGGLVAWNDDWDEEKDARVVLEDPSGLTLIVGSLDGERGEYEICCEEASDRDVDDFSETLGLLETGYIRSWVVDDKENENLEDMVLDQVEYYVWLEGGNIWSTGFGLERESLITVVASSDDFSPVMVLLERDGDDTEYIAHNDYYEEGGARIDWVLEPGDYMLVITSYGGTEDGEFELSMDVVDDLEELRADYITVDRSNESYEAFVEAGRNLLSTVWPEVSTGEYYDVYATGSEPCAVFQVEIDETGLYDFTASGENVDVSLILLELEDEETQYIAYSSYGTDGKFNTRLSRVLTPGTYLAVAFPYYGGQDFTIGFSYSASDAGVERLTLGDTAWPYINWEQTQYVYSIVARPGTGYEITAVSDMVDPVIELYIGEDEYLTDDDGYGGYNSCLTFSVEEPTECLLLVRTFSEWEEGEIEVRLGRGEAAPVPSARRVDDEEASGEPGGEPEEGPDLEEEPPAGGTGAIL